MVAMACAMLSSGQLDEWRHIREDAQVLGPELTNEAVLTMRPT